MYEIFEHTADIGIRVRAESRASLFADAARGLFAVMVSNLDAVQCVEEMSLEIAGGDDEELLHDWLAELLYTFHARRRVLAVFEVQTTPTGLSAIVRGEPIDLKRHTIEVEVKAITWHALKVESTDGAWLAEFIVDV
jgi:SHS2 domain-containing protein